VLDGREAEVARSALLLVLGRSLLGSPIVRTTDRITDGQTGERSDHRALPAAEVVALRCENRQAGDASPEGVAPAELVARPHRGERFSTPSLGFGDGSRQVATRNGGELGARRDDERGHRFSAPGSVHGQPSWVARVAASLPTCISPIPSTLPAAR